MNFSIWVWFLFPILIGDIHLTTAQDNFWGYYCPPSGRNYTYNETYKQNLNDLFYSLTEKDNGFGFYNSTIGLANAAALCYGDIGPERCRRCVDDATRRLRQICPDKMEAVGWYDVCLLRYSDRFTDIGDDIHVLDWNVNLIPNSTYKLWNQTVVSLLGSLRSEAAGGDQLRKYASGNVTVPGLASTIYGMAQCTPDLSAMGCYDCLARATEVSQLASRNVGARVNMPYCVLRHENYTFFNSTWFPPPPGPPPPGPPPPGPPPPEKTKSINIRIIVGPILAAAVVITMIIFFIFRRHQKRKRKGQPKVSFHLLCDGFPCRKKFDICGKY